MLNERKCGGVQQPMCSRSFADGWLENESMQTAGQLGSRRYLVGRYSFTKQRQSIKEEMTDRELDLLPKYKHIQRIRVYDLNWMLFPVLAHRVVVPQACCDKRRGWSPPCQHVIRIPSSRASTAWNLKESNDPGRHRPNTFFEDDFTTSGRVFTSARHSLNQYLRSNSGKHCGTWQSRTAERSSSNSFQAWNLYNRLPTPTAKAFRTQKKQQAEYVTLLRQLNATSAQNEFSKWAKLQRQVDKLTVQLEKQSTSRHHEHISIIIY